MNILTTELREVTAENVIITKNALKVELADGRTIGAPLAWYPRLLHGTAKERSNWRFIGEGEGIHWPDLDEDISVENVCAVTLPAKVNSHSKNGSRLEKLKTEQINFFDSQKLFCRRFFTRGFF